jgi:hypothetical protein
MPDHSLIGPAGARRSSLDVGHDDFLIEVAEQIVDVSS